MFNKKKHTEIDFYMELLPLNLMNMGRKRLLDDDIQIIVIEAPQPSKLSPAKNSGRNINCVLRKRGKGKTRTPTTEPKPEPEPEPELVVL